MLSLPDGARVYAMLLLPNMMAFSHHMVSSLVLWVASTIVVVVVVVVVLPLAVKHTMRRPVRHLKQVPFGFVTKTKLSPGPSKATCELVLRRVGLLKAVVLGVWESCLSTKVRSAGSETEAKAKTKARAVLSKVTVF